MRAFEHLHSKECIRVINFLSFFSFFFCVRRRQLAYFKEGFSEITKEETFVVADVNPFIPDDRHVFCTVS